jgi:tetratricopeptide (TPR) repeat protein
VIFYQSGDYQRAILFFNEFLRFFPSREVYHNLASSHHQLALKYYKEWKGEELAIPLKLSMAIDPETQASKITLKPRGGIFKSPEELFKEHIEKAIGYYEIAISQDPSYILSYNNLGCAFLMKGESEEAIARFKKALKLKSDFKEALNNLGVALFYDEKPNKAKEALTDANKLDPTYNAPLFNLGKIAHEGRKEYEAREYWSAYLRLDPKSPWANAIRKTFSFPDQQAPPPMGKTTEKILGLKIGDYDDEFPKDWKKLQTKDIPLEEEPYRLITYNNGVMTLSQKYEIKLIVTLEGFKGKTEKGIAVGSTKKDVFSAYGSPAKVLDMTQGASWAYHLQGIVFQFRDGKVVSWILFENQ